MDINTLGYLAGVIDGEGHIGIEKTKRNNKARYISPRYMPNVCVINTSKELIDWLQRKWGGSVNVRSKKMTSWRPHWKTCYRWRLNQGRIAEFLTAIRPYMIVKRRQVDLMLRYYKERKSYKKNSYQDGKGHIFNRKCPPEEIAFREAIYRQMKNLNHYDPQRLNEETPQKEDDVIVRTFE